MNGVIEDFRAKVREVSLFIRWLELADHATSEMTITVDGALVRRPIDREFCVMLRANAFLLLYNLMEATTFDLVEALCAGFNGSNVRFQDASDVMRSTWLQAKIRSLRDAAPDKWVDCVRDLLVQVAEERGVNIEFSKVLHATAGNVDARKVREIAESFGFSCDARSIVRGGDKLLTVKNRRNALAHGDLSFVECGRDYQIKDIVAIKRQVVAFLWVVLKNGRGFLNGQGYARYREHVML